MHHLSTKLILQRILENCEIVPPTQLFPKIPRNLENAHFNEKKRAFRGGGGYQSIMIQTTCTPSHYLHYHWRSIVGVFHSQPFEKFLNRKFSQMIFPIIIPLVIYSPNVIVIVSILIFFIIIISVVIYSPNRFSQCYCYCEQFIRVLLLTK